MTITITRLHSTRIFIVRLHLFPQLRISSNTPSSTRVPRFPLCCIMESSGGIPNNLDKVDYIQFHRCLLKKVPGYAEYIECISTTVKPYCPVDQDVGAVVDHSISQSVLTIITQGRVYTLNQLWSCFEQIGVGSSWAEVMVQGARLNQGYTHKIGQAYVYVLTINPGIHMGFADRLYVIGSRGLSRRRWMLVWLRPRSGRRNSTTLPISRRRREGVSCLVILRA